MINDRISFDSRLDRSALVLIDMQQGYTDPENVRGRWIRKNQPEVHRYFFDQIARAEANLAGLLGLYRRARRPVVHVTFGWNRPDRSDLRLAVHRSPPPWADSDDDLRSFAVGGEMHRIVDSLLPSAGETVLNKTSHSAFTSTSIDEVLKTADVDQIVIGGWATNACVELTARDAADRGYETFMVEDACAAFSPSGHECALAAFGELYGAVVLSDDVFAAR